MSAKIKIALSVLLGLASLDTFSQDDFSFYELAKQHSLVRKGPAPDFFEGALIGNGGMGVVVCTRPDAVMLRFGQQFNQKGKYPADGNERMMKGDILQVKVRQGQKILPEPEKIR